MIFHGQKTWPDCRSCPSEKNPRRKEGPPGTGAVAVFDMIYFLEDDNSIRELVVYTMNSTGFDAVGFSKPREFWAAMEQELPSLILLDIMLPEEDGLQILKSCVPPPPPKKLPCNDAHRQGQRVRQGIGSG